MHRNIDVNDNGNENEDDDEENPEEVEEIGAPNGFVGPIFPNNLHPNSRPWRVIEEVMRDRAYDDERCFRRAFRLNWENLGEAGTLEGDPPRERSLIQYFYLMFPMNFMRAPHGIITLTNEQCG